MELPLSPVALLSDFRTYEEAKEYKKQFVEAYPAMIGDTYIVRDKIKVLQ